MGTSSDTVEGLCGDIGSVGASEETSGAVGSGAGADADAGGSCIGERERLGVGVPVLARPWLASAASNADVISSGEPTRGSEVTMLFTTLSDLFS